MRILFLAAPGPNLDNWISGLRQFNDLEIRVWSLHDGLQRKGKLSLALKMMTFLPGLKRLIRRWKPDILICYRTPSYGFLGALTGFHPLVVAAQGARDLFPLNSPLLPVKERLARFALRNADLIHAWAQHMADNLVELGAERQTILVLPRGIELELYRPLGQPPDWTRLTMVCTRSLYEEYGHRYILEAVAAVDAEGIPVALILIGDGPIRQQLVQQANDLDISDKVIFVGRIDRKDVVKYLQKANVYVSLPDTEGLSASLLEAMACGCYPIVSNLPANKPWIEPENTGKLVTPRNATMLAEAMVDTYRNHEVCDIAIKKNLERVRREGSAKDNITRFVEEYRKLIDRWTEE